MALRLRQAIAEDAGPVRDIVKRAYALYVRRMGREPAPMLADYAGLIARGHVSVVDEDEVLLGAMVSYNNGDHLHVENVAVTPEAQGKGVGHMLMAHAEWQCGSEGLTAIELYTNEVMAENFPFYEALGYRITGRRVEDGYRRVYFRKDTSSKKLQRPGGLAS